MNKSSAGKRFRLAVVVVSLAAITAGCGNGGSGGTSGAGGSAGGSVSSGSSSLSMTITGVTIDSPPVVNFRVTNASGGPVVGLTSSDLRFTIAKLIPGTNGNPSKWQSYINRASGGFVQATRETPTATSLVDHGDGTYTYTFATDIKDASQTCPPPCTDADGQALDTSYNPNLTHRVAIQSSGSQPASVVTYDFRPSDGATTGLFEREIVDTAKCNQCHNQLEHHDSRIDTRYCVTCHNPGTTASGKEGTWTGGLTVDFKSMIHKIHRGESLPSVVAGGDYGIVGYSGSLSSFKDVVFPQDIRNCTKCHDGADTATPQGDNWETQPSIEACGSCHDDVYFGPAATKSYQTKAHPGGVVTDNSQCLTCHATGKIAGSIAEKHSFPAKLKAEGAKYKLNIVSVTSTQPTQNPTITFSITDPTNGDAPYDIANTPAIYNGSMSLLIGWHGANRIDFSNSGSSDAQPISISITPPSSGSLATGVTGNGDGTYSFTSSSVTIPSDATDTGRVGFYARMSADVDGDGTNDTIPVTSVVKDFLITGSSVVARRTVVDIANCDQCHDQLTLHGSMRTDQPQLCVMCHNPNATDVSQRPKNSSGLPDATATKDSKKEEAIDFKRLIHGIHAAATKNYDGTTAHGFRDKGLVIYGYRGSVNDFSDVRFPGILKDCTTCHTTSSYKLTGIWATPTTKGILASTIDTAPSATDASSLATALADPTDDLNITPTAAVCSSCHDSTKAQNHMDDVSGTYGNALFSATQATIDSRGEDENCANCHGPGKSEDVATVHGL